MKRFAIAVLFTILFTTVNPAKAEGLSWTGFEVLLPVSAEIEVADQIGIRAQMINFFVPARKVHLSFFYAGPTFTPVLIEHPDATGDPKTDPPPNFVLWVSPQFVGAANWYGTEDVPGDGIGPSVMLNMNAKGKFNVFLEIEAYFPVVADAGLTYYGFYSVDGAPKKWLNLGGQAEQVNDGIIFGPHVGMTKGPFHVEVQYYLGLQDVNRGHSIRLVTALGF